MHSLMHGLRRNTIRTLLLAAFTVGGSILLSGSLARDARGQGAYRSGPDPRVAAQAESYTGDRFRFETETPRGAHVVARVRPRPEALHAIDDGLAALFAVARRHGYRAHVNYADYTVFIARADRTRDSTGAYSPDIAVNAPTYAGSVYDQGGYIYAAGMVSSYQPSALIVAEHDRDWQHLANVVRYEGEHLVLYYNDRARFAATSDHTRGGAHPILQ